MLRSSDKSSSNVHQLSSTSMSKKLKISSFIKAKPMESKKKGKAFGVSKKRLNFEFHNPGVDGQDSSSKSSRSDNNGTEEI